MTKLKLFFSVTLLFISLHLVSCGGSSKSHKDLTVDEQYPKPWRDPNREELLAIGQTLVKNNISGCGEYYIRPSSQSTGEYLVGCSSDGTTWTYYMVWTAIQNVMGPYSDTTISKPR
jgi:hypothetical protein